MKFPAVFFLIAFLTVFAGAQIQNVKDLRTAPNLEIVRYKWESYYNPLNRRYASSITAEDEARARERQKRTNPTEGNTVLPSARDPFVVSPKLGSIRSGFLYTIVLKNKSGKTIKNINWSYFFLNPKNLNVIAEHKFSSDSEIKTGKQKKIQALSVSKPVKVIDADLIEENLPETAVVTRVEYADGTVWERFPTTK